jgi:hypothetical protein
MQVFFSFCNTWLQSIRIFLGGERWGVKRWGVKRWGEKRWGVKRWGVKNNKISEKEMQDVVFIECHQSSTMELLLSSGVRLFICGHWSDGRSQNRCSWCHSMTTTSRL